MNNLDKQQLSEMLGEIYDAVLYPSKLSDLATSIVQALGLQACSLLIVDDSLNQIQALAESGWYHLNLHRKKALQVTELVKAIRFNVSIEDQSHPKNEMAGVELENNILLNYTKQDSENVLLSTALLDRNRYSCVIFVSESDLFLNSSVEQNLLIKHLHNMLRQLKYQIQVEEIENLSLNALDKAGQGVILFDQNGCPVHINNQAKQVLDVSVLQLTPKGLLGNSDELTQAIHQTHFRSIQEGRTLKLLVADWQEGEHTCLLFVPLAEGQTSILSEEHLPASAIFIHRLDQELAPPASLLRDHFLLSPRESEIAVLISQGWSLAEIGEKLGIKHYTVKVHLKSIFEKMGVNTQSKLSAKLLNLVITK